VANSEKVTFAGAFGDQLAARLDTPDGDIRAFALFAHCFTCSKDIFAAARVSQALAEQGFAVLRFDFTGLGASEGEFANTNFSSNVDDLVAAASWLKDNHQAPALLVGHSLGGAAVLAAAARLPEVKAVATIGAPGDPEHVVHNFGAKIDEISETGEAEVQLAGRSFTIKKQFLEDIETAKLTEAVGGFRKALLVFHSPVDQTVGIDNAGLIYQAAKHPKSFVSLDDADHLLSRRADAVYVADVLSAWASRYLTEQEETTSAHPDLEGHEVVVYENGHGKFGQNVWNGRHEALADEPEKVGGLDAGPDPYGYLSAALGACTSMTLRLYADRKKLPLEKVLVRVKHDKVHAEDCESCETKEGKVDRLQREIEIIGDLDDAARQRLLEIADKCPVHQTLERSNLIETRLAD
jgi:uncharacterized OsmC-like protein/alpha/beta superfamily hydrolase